MRDHKHSSNLTLIFLLSFFRVMNIVRRIPTNKQTKKIKTHNNNNKLLFAIKKTNKNFTKKVIPNSLQLSLNSLKLNHRLVKYAHGRLTIEYIIAR